MIKRYKFVFIILGILLVALSIISFLLFRKKIVFSVFNYNEVVDVNSEYSYPDVSACYGDMFKCKDISYEITDDIDTSAIGDYKIDYYASYKGKKESISLNVKVVDREAPIINAPEAISACPGASEYNIDYSVVDNYDTDLDSFVSQEVLGDSILLTVSDSSGNSNSKNVVINYEDTISPVITLNGGSSIYLPINSKFSDPGYSVSDNCDVSISSKVNVSGTVDTSKVGAYIIKYSVTDASGNTSYVNRTVSVYDYSNNGNKVVYLTFDDGPSQYTGELLDILAKYKIKATFFVTGRNSNYEHFIKRAYDEGHAIGLHTNSHNYSLIYSSVDAYFEDLNIISEKVKKLTGIESKIMRFPGGSSNTVSRITPGIMTKLVGEVQSRGYYYFDWNVSSGDASGTILSSEQYANNIIKALGNNSGYIVLQHDTNVNSIRAVSKVIEYGLSHGYKFDVLSPTSHTSHHKVAN